MPEMLVADLIEEFIRALRTQKGYSDHTIEITEVDLEQFLHFLMKARESGKKPSQGESVNFRSGSFGTTFRELPKNNDCTQAICDPILFQFS
jgi:topoisomerase IA-like protein